MAYIDFRLYFFGEIGRPDLIERFGVAPAGATRDLALYREIAPQNITFDGSHKIYRIGQAFSPLFDHAPQRVLSALAMGFGDGVNGPNQSLQPLLPCESPTALSHPKMDVLAPVCRAIHAKRPVAIRYHSMSSGESERVIVPFALVDTGLRWHVRAFDRKSGEFRDFVVTRIEAPTLLDEEPQASERPDNDIQWTRIVELELIPQPLALGVAQALDALGMSHRRLLIQDGRPKDCDWFYVCPLLGASHHQTDDIMRHNLDYNNTDVATPWEASSMPCLGIESTSAIDGWMRQRSAKGR
ncbi:hypothetical protein R1479_02368 [Ralstonia mannitolilytica]|uniref:transcriptional regulator n=1 Tax=Ralstonia mannitolilytica TaxID=105219 RepID=UPI0028F5C42A|nr:WYL domain-containing protein [Ralstonia mannitolilytica]CAJ0877581.1 hypothetical protein R1479_02368 [Ralstonia mannitolilytica]